MSTEQRRQSASETGGFRFSKESMTDVQREQAEERAKALRTTRTENLVAAKVVFNPVDRVIG